MTSLRRTVEGWMGDDLYRKLGTEPNIELTWKLLRDLIGQQLFGSEYVAVPYINSAAYYNQLFVFTKKRSVLSSLGLKPPTYKIVGNLDYLVNREFSTWIPQFDFSPWDVADGLSMYREYKLRVSSNNAELEKNIELSVLEAHSRSAIPPNSGSLTIHMNLVEEIRKTNTLYVITDVVFASYIKLTVNIGTQVKSLIYDTDVPIGFRYKKYKIHRSGTFLSEIPTGLQFTEKEAIWLRPLPQPVPTVPRWDPMRRRYTSNGSRRKARNNLTIPTPETPRNSTWLQEGGLIRMERPFENRTIVHALDVHALDIDNNRAFEDDDWRHILNQRRAHDAENLNVRNRRSLSMDNIPVNQ